MAILVKHLYDYSDWYAKRFGTVVCVDGNIGVSICNPKDTFQKKMGVKIAVGRAQKRADDIFSVVPENRKVMDICGLAEQAIDVVRDAVAEMQERAKKYFKADYVPPVSLTEQTKVVGM